MEELQPIPLEAETELGAGELEPVDGEEPYAADAQTYATGAEGYAAEPEPYATGAEGYANGVEPYAAGAEPFSAGPEGYAAGTEPYAAGAEPQPADAEPHAAAAAYAVESGGAAEGAAPQRDLTEEEVEILAALDRLAHGDEATPTVVRPAQLLAALIRLMMRKQWITEHELLDEILRG